MSEIKSSFPLVCLFLASECLCLVIMDQTVEQFCSIKKKKKFKV